MAHCKEKEALHNNIRLLKIKQAKEIALLKEQLQLSYESVQPVNIIKTALHEVVTSPQIKNNLLQHLQVWAAEYLSKKIIAGKHPGMFRKVLGIVVSWGVAQLIHKRAD